MWLIPFKTSPSVPESAGSTSPPGSPSSAEDTPFAPWVTSSGTATPRPSSWPAWKNRAWKSLLFGAVRSRTWTPDLCTDGRTALPPVSPVSPTAKRGVEGQSTMSDGSGRRSPKSFARFGLDGSCSRMFAGSFLPGMEPPVETFCETWPTWGSLRNGVCYRQKPWVPAMSASDGFAWPTPLANPNCPNNGTNRGNGVHRARNVDNCLSDRAKGWATPMAADDGEDPENWELRRQQNLAKGVNGNGQGTPLTIASQTWPTPDATAGQRGHSGYSDKQLNRKEGTPRILNYDAIAWATPGAASGGSRSRGGDRVDEPLLGGQAATWSTPAARDYRTPNSAESQARRGKRTQQLQNQVEHQFSHPLRVTLIPGDESSTATPTSPRRLNPAFVCFLMGSPWFWTRAESINCGAQVTAWWYSALQRLLLSLSDG